MGPLRMAHMLSLTFVSLLAIFARAQDLQECSAVTSPYTVGSTEDASTLSNSLVCSTGAFDVQWIGEVFVAETIHVTDGTSLSITSTGSSAAIADGRNVTQLFVADRGSSLHFSDMTFAHGNGSFGGAINAVEASVSFGGNVSFVSNSAGVDGGAIFANLSSITWGGDSTEFIFNLAGDDGGAIYLTESTLSWDGDGTHFTSNSAGDNGGAILAFGSNVSWDGDGTHFTSNSADDNGGAIHVVASTVSWGGDDTRFVFNSANDSGGAISAYAASILLWGGDGTLFSSNTAGGDDGGAIYVVGSTVSWGGDDTKFLFNSANDSGGAIFAFDAPNVSWYGDGTQFLSNSAGDDGGAISADSSSVVFWGGDGTQFSSNSAQNRGGAILASTNSIVYWSGEGTQFTSNFANFSGGAILASTGSFVYWVSDNTQFSSNSASDEGGAISMYVSNVFWGGDRTLFSSNFVAGEEGALNFDDNGGAIYATDSSALSWTGNGTHFSSNSAGYEGGAICVERSTIVWNGNDTRFSSNSVGYDGGAISIQWGSLSWNGDGTNFSSNSAGDRGGAISMYSSTVDWDGNGTQFSYNSAADEGGGAIFAGTDSTVSWRGDGTKFVSNSAIAKGGAIFVSYADVFWDDDGTQFISNSAGDSGGAIFVTGSATLSSDGLIIFSRNAAGKNGGAISLFGSQLPAPTFHGGVFEENRAENGGALHFGFSVGFNLTDVTFISNSATVSGGAVAAYTAGREDLSSYATFTRCNFSDNVSENGGAVEAGAGRLEFTYSFFEGNSADVGGAMRLGGTTIVRECSFLSNSASVRGFAVAAVNGSANISSSSFEGNELYCESGSYRKDTEKARLAARYESVCSDCPEWDECLGCSMTRGNVVPTCEAPLEHTEAKQPDVTLETLSVAEGYWRATNDSVNILACYNVDACVGGQTGAEEFCAQGYTGPYCAVCEPDYSASLSYTCTRCSSSRRQGFVAVTVIAALMLACVVVAIVRYLVSTQLEEERNAGCFRRRVLRYVPLQALKIIVVVWQILIQFADAAGVTYPGAYQDFVRAIDVVNFDLGSVISAGCLWSDMDFHDRLLVNTLGPLVVVGLLGITYLVAMYRSSSAAGGDAVVEKIRYRHQTVLLLVTFLIYSSVSSTVFRTFACETLDDGEEYLRADYSIQCTEAKHKNFEIYAGIMVAVYPIGIPLLYGILLFQRRDVLASASADRTKAASIVGLWEPYRPERFYYEVVECGRRIMLTGVVVFIFPNDAAQIAITMLLAFFFFMIFEMLRPYASECDMWLSRGGHMTVFLSMFYLLLQKVDVSGERGESQAIYGGLLVACHVFMVLAIVVEVVGICYSSRGKKPRDII
ncbi:unnamed protein product [Ectocarpus sp. 13 AM-2016]